jgi:hypothetical protein
MSGANMSGADMSGANMRSAKIGDHILVKKLAQIRRDDGYEFIAFTTTEGLILIRAGCRTKTLPEYREHIKTYSTEAKKVETTQILDFIQQRSTYATSN